MGVLVQKNLHHNVQVLLTALATSFLLLIAMPGRLGWWLFLFVALVPLLVFVAQNSSKKSFRAGLITGFLYHAGMLYWIVIVLGRYGGVPTILSVPSMLLLALYMSLYTGLFAGRRSC